MPPNIAQLTGSAVLPPPDLVGNTSSMIGAKPLSPSSLLKAIKSQLSTSMSAMPLHSSSAASLQSQQDRFRR
jgi:hypothetical protein